MLIPEGLAVGGLIISCDVPARAATRAARMISVTVCDTLDVIATWYGVSFCDLTVLARA